MPQTSEFLVFKPMHCQSLGWVLGQDPELDTYNLPNVSVFWVVVYRQCMKHLASSKDKTESSTMAYYTIQLQEIPQSLFNRF